MYSSSFNDILNIDKVVIGITPLIIFTGDGPSVKRMSRVLSKIVSE